MSATGAVGRQRGGWFAPAVRYLAAALLLVAAAAKLFWPLPWDAPQDPLLSMPWVRVTVIQAEFGLGVWLASGVGLRHSSQVAAGFFLLLGWVALWKTLRGESSCGCFGPLQVSPAAMLALDWGIAGLLATLNLQNLRSLRRNCSTKNDTFQPGNEASIG